MIETTRAQNLINESSPGVGPAAEPEIGHAHRTNSVDATAGQPIVARVMARKHELEALRTALPDDELRIRGDIDLALTTIDELLTGDLEHVPAVVVSDMSRWLERNKHLAESAVEQVIDPVTARFSPRVAAD